MINTIFYFAESLSLEDYISQVQSGEISPKTIVLASELKSVYKGGRMFGRMLYEDLKSEIEKMFRNDDSSSVKRYIQDLIDSRAYDDTLLRNALSEVDNAITRLNNTADSEQERLNQLLNTLNSRVQSAFEGLLTDANWVLQNMPKQEVTWKSGWDDEVKAVLSTVGYWDGDGENWTTKYSRIVQSVNSISSTVADILSNQYDGSTVTEAISSAINLAINDGIASLDLSTSFTQVTEDANKIKQVVLWLYSGLKSLTSPNYGTFASLYAAGSNNINNAISEIRAEVTKLKNGEYLATSSVESAVDGAIAGLYNKVTNTHASAEVFSKIKSNSTAIAGLETSVGEVLTDVDGLKTTLSSTANLIAALGDASSGLVLKATYDGDLADLNAGISENASAIANLSTQVGGLSAGVLNEVDTRIRTATSTLVARSEVENGTIAASVVAKVNEEGSLLKLNADRIDLTSSFLSTVAQNIEIDASKITVTAGNINLNTDFINAIGANVTVKKLSVKRNNADIDPTVDIGVSGNIGNITLRDPSVTVDGHYAKVSEIKSDGSVNFANGTIVIPKTSTYSIDDNDTEDPLSYGGTLIIRTGSTRSDFDKVSNLLIQSPFTFTAKGSGDTIPIYNFPKKVSGFDELDTFTYREQDFNARILSTGPYLYKDVYDGNKIHWASKLSTYAYSLNCVLDENNIHNYISNGYDNKLGFTIEPGFTGTLIDNLSHGLIWFKNIWVQDSNKKHCATLRVGDTVHVYNDGTGRITIPTSQDSGIKTELLNGLKVGLCYGDFGPNGENNPQIQILNLKGKFQDTLNTVIPYKDGSGNTKYLGIVAGLVVYNGITTITNATVLHEADGAYFAAGISNPDNQYLDVSKTNNKPYLNPDYPNSGSQYLSLVLNT